MKLLQKREGETQDAFLIRVIQSEAREECAKLAQRIGKKYGPGRNGIWTSSKIAEEIRKLNK